jgi:hypothetical protein
MKTTIDINDRLLEAAKRRAQEQRRTLRDLVEEGLRSVLKEEREAKPFELRDVPPFTGAVQPEVDPSDWEAIRDIIYGLR